MQEILREPCRREYFLPQIGPQMSLICCFPDNLHLDSKNWSLQTSIPPEICEIKSRQIKVGLH